MFTLDVRADVADTVRRMNAIKAGLGDQVIVVALNETLAQTNTQMARAIGREYNIKQADIKEKLQQKRASRKGDRYVAELSGNPYGRSKRALNLIRFLDTNASLKAWKKAKAGTVAELQFQVRKGRRFGLRRAFIMNVAGHPVFIRTGPGRKDIEPARTIGIPQMFNAHKVQDPVQAFIPPKFKEIFDRRVKYFLSTVN